MQKYVSESSRVDAFQFFRIEIQLTRQLLNLAADRPVEILRNAALVERQITQAEQIQRRIERLLRIVIGLQQIALSSPNETFPANR